MNGAADVTIRRASLADVPRVVPLFLAYLEFYGAPASDARVRAFLSERLQREESVIFLATGAAPDCGFTQLYPGFSSLALARVWTLEDLYVVPAARKRGIARALLARAERHAAETGAVRLSLMTAASNHGAQRVYEAAGWLRDDRYVTYERTVVPAEYFTT